MINYPDFMLYDHFNATFWARIEKIGLEKVQAMADEIKDFSKDLEDECIDGYREVESWNGKMIKGMRFTVKSMLVTDVGDGCVDHVLVTTKRSKVF